MQFNELSVSLGKNIFGVFIASDFLNIIYPVLFFRTKYFDFLSHFANDVRSASFQETLLQHNFILLKLCIIIFIKSSFYFKAFSCKTIDLS